MSSKYEPEFKHKIVILHLKQGTMQHEKRHHMANYSFDSLNIWQSWKRCMSRVSIKWSDAPLNKIKRIKTVDFPIQQLLEYLEKEKYFDSDEAQGYIRDNDVDEMLKVIENYISIHRKKYMI